MGKNLKTKLFIAILACATAVSAGGIFAMNQETGFVAANAETSEGVEETTPAGAGYSMQIVSKNVSYSEALYIIYAVGNEGFDRRENPITMLFWDEEQESYSVGTESYATSEGRGALTIGGIDCQTYYSEGIAAKEMNDSVYCRAYAVVDGVEVYSEVQKYSVVDYVYERRASGQLTEKQKAAYDALLAYGSAMQDLFDHNTDNPADKVYYTVTVENGTIEGGFTWGRYEEGTVLTLTANPAAEGYSFLSWQDETGTTVSEEMTFSVTVAGTDKVFTAVYHSEKPEGDYLYEVVDGAVKITKYTAKLSAVTIPEQIDGLPVTIIGESAFANTITSSVVIPASVTTIEDFAFYATRIKSVNIGSAVTSIGYQAFAACNYLDSIVVDGNNTEYSSLDGNLYSKDGQVLIQYAIGKTETAFTTPEGMSTIDTVAFESANILTEVVILDNVTVVAENAFSGCNNLTIYCQAESQPTGWAENWNPLNRPVVWGYKVPTAASEFAYTKGSSSVTITAYNGTAKEVVIPSYIEGLPVTTIGGMVSTSSNFTSIIIPETVTSIKQNAFKGSAITSATFVNTNGWTYTNNKGAITNISSADLADPTTAANYLKNKYVKYAWDRN